MITEEQTNAPDPPVLDEIRTFFAVMATALRETAVHFEETTARVAELTVMRGGRADRDLVVALQNFDRLQQELATLADVFILAAAKSSDSWLRTVGNGHPVEDAIAKIPIAHLKERLVRNFGIAMSVLTTSPISEDAVFEDAVF